MCVYTLDLFFLSKHVQLPPYQWLLLHYSIFALLFTKQIQNTGCNTKYILCYALFEDTLLNYNKLEGNILKVIKGKNTNILPRIYKIFLLRKNSKPPQKSIITIILWNISSYK